MRRALLVLAFLSCRDARAPEPPPATTIKHPGRTLRRPPPQLAFTLSVAESANEPAMWTAVADAHAAELTTCTTDCRERAREVVDARLHALQSIRRQPRAGIPPELDAAVAAIDDYVARLDTTDDQVAPMKFTAASALWRYREDNALPRLEELLRDHRDHATAEYAANKLLHLLLHQNRIEELHAWMAELSADETFLTNKPELRATLDRLRELFATL